MGLWQDFLSFFSKNPEKIPKDTIKKIESIPSIHEIIALDDDEIEESKKRIEIEKFKNKKEVLTEIPIEEIEIIEKEILRQRQHKSQELSIYPNTNHNSRISKGIPTITEEFPKKCKYCPEHKNYIQGQIHRCPDCEGEVWICSRHYQGHVLKNHGSNEYRVGSNEIGHSNFKFPK
jgi:hypothetical protein